MTTAPPQPTAVRSRRAPPAAHRGMDPRGALAPASRAALLLAAALATALAGCSREPAAPGASSASAAASSAAPQPAALVNDGSPRIADSPAGRVHVQYRVYGSGEPLVVLVHGWSCDSNYWQAQVADLKTRYTVATVDLAGHGGSGANRDDWSMAAFGADVAAVVEALKDHPKVVLVGHSMGGPVVVEAARRIGPRVVGVIGLDTLKDIGQPKVAAAETARRLAPFERDFIGATRALVEGTMFTPGSDAVLKRRIVDDMSQAPPAIALAAIHGMNDWDGASAMRALERPIVAINSNLGGVTDEARIHALVPRYRLVTVTGLGHFLMMEDPARVNPILDAEIRKLAGL